MVSCVLWSLLLSYFLESCILPCSTQVNDNLVIVWTQLTSRLVHSYFENQDQLEHQDQHFRGRTSLFKDQISRGNASLQLTGVEVQDQDRYRCYTMDGMRDTQEIHKTTCLCFLCVQYSVNVVSNSSQSSSFLAAPVSKVNMEQVGNRIICSSEGIYPEPDLTWSTSPPSNLNLQNQTSIQQTEQQLYNISSSLILSDSETDLIYICTISTRSNSRRVSLFIPSKCF
uniref:Ig-like domain-containing protein n=1 Tax=Lates calcarifer TaxID=8187 RepID=A0A4W6G4P0_LATCA